MLAATHIELSHTNSNIFATFKEWNNLAEQKKCSKKGPSGNNFYREKKSISRSSTNCSCPRTVLFRHALCYYNFGALSLFLHFYNAQQWTRGILLHPQISTNHPVTFLLPSMIFIQRQKKKLFCSHFNYTVCCMPTSLQNKSITMWGSILTVTHPIPNSILYPKWINLIRAHV